MTIEVPADRSAVGPKGELMDHRKWEQLGGGAGIVAMAMIVVAIFLPGTIQPDDSALTIRQFMIDNRQQLLVQAVLVGGGLLLFLLFLATLRNVLRRTEGETGELSAVMSGSALIAVAMLLIAMAIAAGTVWRSAAAVNPALAQLMFDITSVVIVFVGVPIAVFAGTSAVLMRRSAAFPVWMPALGWVAAVLNLLAPLTLFFTKGAWSPIGAASYVPTIAFFLFVIGAGAVLVQHPEAGEVRMPSTVTPQAI
jgi:hypothetical protein